jgi:TRAP-type C4-dicarboxylate transport system substrate-binding protein
MKATLSLMLSLLLIAAIPQPSFSQSQVVIKLGSLAPIGSPWDTALKKINAEWTRISGGMVSLKIYSGGIAGNEPDMIRKMRLNQLDAAGITGFGLASLDLGVMSLQTPLLIQTEEELDYILTKMAPLYEANLEKKGYKVIFWTKVGWAHFFSKQKVIYPDDMKKSKLFVMENSTEEINVWKQQGFNPVPLPANDLMTALQSGMVDTFATSPLTAASYQWFALAPNMNAMKWAPFIGAVMVSTKTWNRIPAELQKKLMASAQKIGREMQSEISNSEKMAMDIMMQNGLKINNIPPDAVQKWAEIVELGYLKMLAGKLYDQQAYKQIKTLLDDYRAGKR